MATLSIWHWIYTVGGIALVWPLVVQYFGEKVTMKNSQDMADVINLNRSSLVGKIRELEERLERQDDLIRQLQDRLPGSERRGY